MPTIKRLADVPFRVGDRYDAALGSTDEHYSTVIRGVKYVDEKQVELTLELTDDEYRRLQEAEQA